MQPDRIQDLEVLLGHTFRDKRLLDNALSHSSIKTDDRPSNERLEFLGDSVLGMLVSEKLYRRFPDSDEGTLTRIKSQAVSRSTLQRIAVAMGLDRFILVGKGVLKREIPASLLGNLFEAIVGAIYLDAGLAATRKFIMRHLRVVIDEIIEDRAEKNYKSLLQHYCQRELAAVPTYRVLREAGPAHNRNFDVAVLVGGKEFGRARAASKKEAEQGSARAAMIHFKAVDENPNKPVRGAGSVLRVGPEGRRGRKKRRGAGAAEAAEPAEAKSSRRRGSSRRGRRARAADESAAAEPEPKKKAAKKTKKKKAAKKATKKKRAPRKKKTKASEPAAAQPGSSKKKRRRRSKKKKPEDAS